MTLPALFFPGQGLPPGPGEPLGVGRERNQLPRPKGGEEGRRARLGTTESAEQMALPACLSCLLSCSAPALHPGLGFL